MKKQDNSTFSDIICDLRTRKIKKTFFNQVNTLLDVLSAGFDYKNGKFTATFAGKDFTASSAEALSGVVASFLMDKHAKQLKGALKDTDPEMFKKLLPELTNLTQDYIKEVIVNKAGEGKTKED